MKERPILFKGEMVRAILEGRKTQTRRIVKTVQLGSGGILGVRVAPRTFCYLDFDGVPGLSWRPVGGGPTVPFPPDRIASACPYGAPGTRLWVKETFRLFDANKECACYEYCQCHSFHGKPLYRADSNTDDKWKPSIFMPRSYSRITLEIVNVRVERLQEISEEDAIAEGCLMDSDGLPKEIPHKDGGRIGWDSAVEWYSWLWESINGEASWELNPWVWVIEFKRVK